MIPRQDTRSNPTETRLRCRDDPKKAKTYIRNHRQGDRRIHKTYQNKTGSYESEVESGPLIRWY